MTDNPQRKAQLSQELAALRSQVSTLEATIAAQAAEIRMLLEREISYKIAAEAEIKKYRDHVEEIVAEHTKKWFTANERLLRQIVEREWAEEELKKITNRYEQAVKAGKVGVWDWDLWNNEIYFDPILPAILGYNDQVIASFDDWMSHVHPEDANRVRTTVQNHFAGEAPDFALEHRMLHADGTIRWFLVRGSTLKDENDAPYRLIGTNTDITEFKQAEEALRLAHRQLSKKAADLEIANAELGQYAYVVSHDLKTPLRAIHNYADFLRYDLGEMLEGDHLEYLAGLIEAVNEAEALVDDLLELSRIGRKEVPLEKIDLQLFLQDLLDAIDQAPDIEIRMAKTWPTIEAETSLLRQIFQNLIQNSLKFNQSTPKTVSLGWQTVQGGRYEFFVQDNGIGIKNEYQDRIFQVFQRLHTTDEYPGTGIGLAIVKKATEKLQGTVRVESVLGQGSTFFVTLPKTQQEGYNGQQ
ncbi:MAG: ATP-binding protein [Anaerolineae bacterium]|nr:ATP-binding protein [Anaerolineae bacterium]